jgi:hypothetical protein
MFFTGATNLFWSWPPLWFRNNNIFWDGILAPRPINLKDQGLHFVWPPFTFLAWLALPETYAPASIVLRVIGAWKPPHQDKTAVLEEDCVMYLMYILRVA